MACTLILGGARSGKSALAECLARASGDDVTYIATSRAGDGEMSARIAHHRAQRPAHWHTVEEALLLADAIRSACSAGRTVLVDCLTLWLTNLLLGEADLAAASEALVAALADAPGPVVLVSNEVGFGIVPDNALARRFRDAQGMLNQRLARVCDATDLVVAGLPMRLSGEK